MSTWVAIHLARAGAVLGLMMTASLLCEPVHAQATLNSAPRVSITGVSELQRADTLCVQLQDGQSLSFDDLSVSDADVGVADLRVRVELEPGGLGAPSVLIPGLSGLPGVTIIREEPDRIRFSAPLTSVNSALAALVYQSEGLAVDVLDIIVDDQQLPPLSAEFRLWIEVLASTSSNVARCRPPPDLQAGSDTGASNEDDITSAATLSFDVTGVLDTDVVQLFNDAELIDQGTATGTSIVLTDPAPVVDTTGLYSVVVNGDLGSAALSVAIVSATVFHDGFETVVN
ncbi:Ig-like domain-containing protein [Pseudomarimonas arenosa]|uniref:Bacterial Ig-like domain-containing protein n=1 Tax=Pseudomarimonas arenosa TaxID=2774145 RepID=A0AAW3ZP25_9GAMM|nr:Ig-like domain-containing protein [Pseudomarimonas arenosa]MBD8526394.1 hypothetical protein [Pseudomarimonas arenosa]